MLVTEVTKTGTYCIFRSEIVSEELHTLFRIKNDLRERKIGIQLYLNSKKNPRFIFNSYFQFETNSNFILFFLLNYDFKIKIV